MERTMIVSMDLQLLSLIIFMLKSSNTGNNQTSSQIFVPRKNLTKRFQKAYRNITLSPNLSTSLIDNPKLDQFKDQL